MRILLIAVVTLVSCSKGGWKEREGPGFVITAPTAGKQIPMESVTIWEYGDTLKDSYQVQLAPMPPSLAPMDAIVRMRDQLAKDAITVERQEDVPMGDVLGIDIRYREQIPNAGLHATRARIVMQGNKLYIAVARRPADKASADADRFVESFKLTAPSDPLAPFADAGMKIDLAVGSADTTGWATARSEKGKFSVSAPGQLNAMEQDVEDGIHLYGLVATAIPERVKYVATCMTGTPKKPWSLDELAATISDATARRDRVIQGYPAIELDVGNASMLAVIVGSTKFCNLVVEPYSKTTKVPPADIRRFFDSFTFE